MEWVDLMMSVPLVSPLTYAALAQVELNACQKVCVSRRGDRAPQNVRTEPFESVMVTSFTEICLTPFSLRKFPAQRSFIRSQDATGAVVMLYSFVPRVTSLPSTFGNSTTLRSST